LNRVALYSRKQIVVWGASGGIMRRKRNSHPSGNSAKNNHSESKRGLLTHTTGLLLPDGRAIELIRDAETGQSALLIFDGKESHVASRIEASGRIYVPPAIHPSTLHAVILPTCCRPYKSTRVLFNEISSLISRVTSLPESSVALLTFFVLSTWLLHAASPAPFLWVVVLPMASCDALFQILRLLCRRSVCLASFSIAELRKLPAELQPTVLTEVTSITSGLIATVRASNRRGTYIAYRNKLVDSFCSKAVFSNQPPAKPELVGFPLEITLGPTSEFVPPMNSSEEEQIAAEFQPRLLMYRLLNQMSVTAPKLALGDFKPPTRALANTLASSIVGDDDLQAKIIPLLEHHDHEFQVDCRVSHESIVLEALLAECHTLHSKITSVSALTQSVNTIFTGRGELVQFSPEMVGWKLKAFRLRTDVITGGWKGLRLSDHSRERIHDLAAKYGVLTVREGPVKTQCLHCRKLLPPLIKIPAANRGKTSG
jgi:hypothetical protein